jgi:hypothetical protein
MCVDNLSNVGRYSIECGSTHGEITLDNIYLRRSWYYLYVSTKATYNRGVTVISCKLYQEYKLYIFINFIGCILYQVRKLVPPSVTLIWLYTEPGICSKC